MGAAMRFFADLHIHSKYSRATSRDCDLENLALWAQRKGLVVVATGDFTHPAWFEELRTKLVPAEPGLMRLRPDIESEVERRLPACCRAPVRFLVSVEISTIYKRDGATRKVHHLIYCPDLASADRVRTQLGRIGNLASDGRPILGLDSRDLLEIALASGEGCFLVPAHIWTPWFSALGSKSGFDSIDACYGDLARHIFAVETGLSSDPPMNWRVSALDRFRLVSSSDAHSPPMLGREACVFDCALDFFAMRRALETGAGFGGTLEFFPEEGKYHLDGHRACGVRLEPEKTRAQNGLCPECHKPLTVGVMHRVEALADRPDGARPQGAAPFHNLVPLPEVVGEIKQVGPKSGSVTTDVDALVAQLGPELAILEDLPLEDVRRAGSSLLAEAIGRVRAGQVRREAGYDGEFGVIRVFEPQELSHRPEAGLLFDLPAAAPAPVAQRRAAHRASAPEDSAEAQPLPERDRPESVEALSPLLRELDEDQRRAALHAEGPLLIVAGPGTGKTRTLTHRFAHLVQERGVPPERCLAITFTRKAAEEMRARLAELMPEAAPRMHVATFHGLGLEMVRELREHLRLPEGFRIASEDERLALAMEVQQLSRREAIRFLKERSRLVRTGALGEPGPFGQAMAARGWLDFDDLLALPVEALSRDAALAQAWRARFAWIAIDEYQDIDELQYRLVRLLSAADGNVCAVGDPDQAIYSFRGADVGFFLRFREDFPGAREVQLTHNYRSNATIVSGALQAIAPSSLVPQRRLDAAARVGGARHIAVHHAHDEEGEAAFVVRTIEALIGGTSHYAIDSGASDGAGQAGLAFGDFAVLYRAGLASAPIVEALTRAGIPFQKRGHDRLLDRPGVRALLGTARRPGSTGPIWETLRAEAHDEPEIHAALEVLEPLARRLGADWPGFVEAIDLGAEVDALDPRADSVSLLTLHASKGLEFPVVFLVGCEDGLLPLRAFEEDDPATRESEERRLFFVGMTRARTHLFLSWAGRRTRQGSAVETRASPFLAAIAGDLLRREEGERTGMRRARPKQLSLI